METKHFHAWKQYIPELEAVLRRMTEKTTIAVGVAPFPRIIPILFLDRSYQIYSVKRAVDIDLLRQYATIFCLEEKHPKIAARVHSTGYLLKNYVFQGFLKSRRYPYRLLFYQTTPLIVQTLAAQHIDWIGNRPETFENVVLKAGFRDVLKARNLPHLEDWRLPREVFLTKSFQELRDRWSTAVVVQRADFDVGGEQGTFFIHTENDWRDMHGILSRDTRFQQVQISPFIQGNSVSMLGCVTPEGILTSPLQLQLIDVPEALHGQLPTGVFLGHDWGFHPWTEATEQTAQTVVESIGEFLSQKGYKGIFGIDFMHEEETGRIFALECNPRFTGALPVFSLMTTAQGIPPIELFHLMAHLNITTPFYFQKINNALKRRLPVAHLSLTPKGVFRINLPLAAGVYSYQKQTQTLRYERPGAFLWNIKNKNEFLLIDSIPYQGDAVIQNVPRLFKLIFPRSIASSSYKIDSEIGDMVTNLSRALRKEQEQPPSEPDTDTDEFFGEI